MREENKRQMWGVVGQRKTEGKRKGMEVEEDVEMGGKKKEKRKIEGGEIQSC